MRYIHRKRKFKKGEVESENVVYRTRSEGDMEGTIDASTREPCSLPIS
jgi:hypothetical protein